MLDVETCRLLWYKLGMESMYVMIKEWASGPVVSVILWFVVTIIVLKVLSRLAASLKK